MKPIFLSTLMQTLVTVFAATLFFVCTNNAGANQLVFLVLGMIGAAGAFLIFNLIFYVCLIFLVKKMKGKRLLIALTVAYSFIISILMVLFDSNNEGNFLGYTIERFEYFLLQILFWLVMMFIFLYYFNKYGWAK
jgi:hypothetical protein